MTDYSRRLSKLLELRSKIDAQIAMECDRQGIALPSAVRPPTRQLRQAVNVSNVLSDEPVTFTGPTLAEAAEQIAAAVERWGDGS